MTSDPLTGQQRIWALMTEAQWQQQVIDIAGVRRWRWWHAPDNRPVVGKGGQEYVQNVKAGFPDLVLVREERLVFAELKRETGKASPEQLAWALALNATAAEVYLWKPHDIADVLRILM